MKNKTKKNKECPIHLIAISTKQHPDMERFIKSAEAHGFKPNILGLKENKIMGHGAAKISIKGYKADFGFKIKYFLEFCKKRKPNDIVLLTDCWDVIFMENCSEMLKKYKAFHKDIVVSAEKFCMPNPFNFYKFNWYTDTFPYLNSGGIIGKAATIISFIEKYWNESNEVDDQQFWQNIYLENKNKIALDTNATIFLTTGFTNMNNYIYEDNKLKYLETNTFPCVVHVPGKESLGFKKYFKILKY